MTTITEFTPSFELFEHLKEVGFHQLVEKRFELSQQIKDIKEEMTDINVQLSLALEVAEVRKVAAGGNLVTLVYRKGNKILDKSRLMVRLVEAGMSAGVVKNLMAECTTLGKSSTSVRIE